MTDTAGESASFVNTSLSSAQLSNAIQTTSLTTTTTAATSSSGPSPLAIGTRFVKQYYNALSSNLPDDIVRFYRMSSLVSVGYDSLPTYPVTFEKFTAVSSDEVKNRFKPKSAETLLLENFSTRFEFEHGSIDAQQSVLNGILLVVTGHVSYVKQSSTELEIVEEVMEKNTFVHTFLLLPATAGGTRVSYYIQNDALRFLKSPQFRNGRVTVEDTKSPIVDATTETKSDSGGLLNVVSDDLNKAEHMIVSPELPENVVEDIPTHIPDRYESKSSETSVLTNEVGTIVLDVPRNNEDTLSSQKLDSFSQPNHHETTTTDTQKPSTLVRQSKKSAKNRKGSSKKKNNATSQDSSKETLQHSKEVTTTIKNSESMVGTWSSLVSEGGNASTNEHRGPVKTPSHVGDIPSQRNNSSPHTAATEKASETTENTATPSKKEKIRRENGKNRQNSTGNRKRKSQDGTNGTITNENDKPINEGTIDRKQDHNRRRSRGKANNKTITTKRHPDFTIVIKNIHNATTETDILDIFQSYAKTTNSNVIGCTITAQRNIAFVDYDSLDPVLKVLEQQKQSSFVILDRTVQIFQKREIDDQNQRSATKKQESVNSNQNVAGSATPNVATSTEAVNDRNTNSLENGIGDSTSKSNPKKSKGNRPTATRSDDHAKPSDPKLGQAPTKNKHAQLPEQSQRQHRNGKGSARGERIVGNTGE